MQNLQERKEQREYRFYYVMAGQDQTHYEKKWTHLKIKVEYDQGGINYFSGNHNPRCYRLSFHPCNAGGTFEESVLMGNRRESGGYIVIEQATRYNAKRLRELAERLDSQVQEITQTIILDNMEGLNNIVKGRQEAVLV